MKTLDADYFIKKYMSGVSCGQLANEAGISHGTMKSFLLKHNAEIRLKPRRPMPSDIEEIVRSGLNIQEIAAKFGVSHGTVTKWRSQIAIGKRDKVFLSDNELCALYRDSHMSENALAIKFGTSRRTIRRRLLRMGITARNQSESESLKWSMMTQDQRLRQVHAAHASVKGRFESDVIEWLRAMQIPCQQSVAVGPYFVDIALDEFPIAVEIETRHGFTIKSRRKRIEYILDQGWCLIYVTVRQKMILIKVGPRLHTLLEMARRRETIFGKYGVISSDSKKNPARHFHFKGIPRIPGF